MTPERIDTGWVEIRFSCKGIQITFKHFTVKLQLSLRIFYKTKKNSLLCGYALTVSLTHLISLTVRTAVIQVSLVFVLDKMKRVRVNVNIAKPFLPR